MARRELDKVVDLHEPEVSPFTSAQRKFNNVLLAEEFDPELVHRAILRVVNAISDKSEYEIGSVQRLERRRLVAIFAGQAAIRSRITGYSDHVEKFLGIQEGFEYLDERNNNSK